MQLHEWQQSFQGAVLGAIDSDKVPLRKKGLSRELSIGIYANAYRERLHEALRDNYHALHQLLGDRDFADMAYAFTAAQPPQAASIRWFGAALPDYLHSTEPYSSCPAIGELAQFEWALRHTVDAADAECIDANFLRALNAANWPGLRCDLHPALTILHFDWNAPQIWRALAAGEAPPESVQFESYWFVYRGADLLSEWRSADGYEAQAIRLWSQGKNFAAICELLEEEIGGAEPAVTMAASFMRTWIEQGLLVHTVDTIQ